MYGLQIRLFYLRFDEEVKHPFWVQEVPGSIPSSSKGFYIIFIVLFFVVVFLFFVPKRIICPKILPFLLQR